MNTRNILLIIAILSTLVQDRHLATDSSSFSLFTAPQIELQLEAHNRKFSRKIKTADSDTRTAPSRSFDDPGRIRIETSLDGFGIRPFWSQANASFSIIYQFEIGEDNHPMHMLLLAGDKYIYPKSAEEGLAKWTLTGLERWKRYVLVLNWEHGLGYTSMSILSEQMKLSIKLIEPRWMP